MKKLERGERVKGALGAAQRRQTRADVAAVRAARILKPCKCGCGESCKATFKRGHTARYYQTIRHHLDGLIPLSLLTPYYRRICANPARAHAELAGRYTHAYPKRNRA